MLQRSLIAIVLVTLIGVAVIAEWPHRDESVTDLTATGGAAQLTKGSGGRVLDVSAERLEPSTEQCEETSASTLIAEAGRLTGATSPESESAWIVSDNALEALDRELADFWRKSPNGGSTDHVFLVTVASHDGSPIDPGGLFVAADERRGHTAVVVLDCEGGSAMRVFPPGFFPLGEPSDFLDPAKWFSDWIAPDGRPATRDVISEYRFSADDHCSWPDVTILTFEGQQYVRDPNGVFGDWPFETTFGVFEAAPSGARNTGFYKPRGAALWLSAPGEPKAAYVFTRAGVERWPAPSQTIACG